MTLGELLGVYSDPRDQTHRYPDGEVVQFVGAVFEATLDTRIGSPDDEVTETGWFEPSALPRTLFAADVPPIRDALSGGRRPFVR